MGPQDPASILKMTKWLVEKKGASVMLKDGLGKAAAHAANKAGQGLRILAREGKGGSRAAAG